MPIEVEWIGFLITELSLVVMALTAICVGSYTAVTYIKSLKDKGEAPEFTPLSTKDAFKLPIMAAAILVLLYVDKIDKIEKKESNSTTDPSDSMVEYVIVVMLVESYSKFIRPLISFLVSPILYDVHYQLCFIKRKGEEEKYLVDKRFTTHGIISFFGCIVLGLWHMNTKNWISNNVIAIVGAIISIKHLHINKMVTGCVLLTLFLIYDVVFVFGTDIMATVATSLEIPAKLTFPRDFMKKGWNDDRFAILGLGDVVLPGAMIAFLLRFDLSLKRNSWFYFYTSTASYLVGMMMTFVAVHFTQRGQPALIYLVPCSVIPPLVLAFFRGDAAELFKFEDHPESENQNEEKKNEDNQPDSSQSLSSSNDITDKKKDD